MPEDPGADALDTALRTLRYRDLSAHDLRRHLEQKDFPASACDTVLETLERTGVLDDRRFAENRARALAGRGSGDALVRYELERAGVAAVAIEDALGALEPEDGRARSIADRRGPGPRTARYLRSKGFSEEAVAKAVATVPHDALG